MIHLRKVLFVNWYKGNKDTKREKMWILNTENGFAVNGDTHTYLVYAFHKNDMEKKHTQLQQQQQWSRTWEEKNVFMFNRQRHFCQEYLFSCWSERTNGWPENAQDNSQLFKSANQTE